MFKLLKDRKYMTVWWALAWRSLIAMLASFIAGGVSGFVIGFILGISGAPMLVIKIVCGTVGALLGLWISLYPLKMVIGEDLGGFKLEIVQLGKIRGKIRKTNPAANRK